MCFVENYKNTFRGLYLVTSKLTLLKRISHSNFLVSVETFGFVNSVRNAVFANEVKWWF